MRYVWVSACQQRRFGGGAELNLKRVGKTAAASVVLVASARAAHRGVSGCEDQVYRAVNDLPDEIAPVAWLPMQAGALAYPLVLSAGIYWRTKTPQPALSIAAAGFSAWLGAKAVKKMVGRGRPFDFQPNTNLRLGTREGWQSGLHIGPRCCVVRGSERCERSHGPDPRCRFVRRSHCRIIEPLVCRCPPTS